VPWAPAHHVRRFVPRSVRRLYRRVVPPPREAQSPSAWDSEYEEGRWEYLDSVEEMARYMVLFGYATCAVEHPAVLDIGCGHGRLLEVFRRLPFGSYLGLDISRVAVESAAAREVPGAAFEVGSFEDWDTNERFDVVVLNECALYAQDPHALVRRALGWLRDDGLLLISLFRYKKTRDHERLWLAIDADTDLDLVDSTIVENRHGLVWDVAALRRRPDGGLDGASTEALRTSPVSTSVASSPST
jgi:2-polyprenyl-3-methyl-5-hydroxy-6-metoxy-1,4-benzoquinol methylase